MRAFIVPQLGPPEVMRLGEVPKPAPGEHDLLVEVHATSVNPVDAKIRVGTRPRTPPVVLGYDVSGIVAATGAQVKGFNIGDEVYGSPNIFGFGANADYVLLDARAAAHKPKSLDHVHAACLPLVSLTAYEALHDHARIQPGQTILIHAGAGGVGHIAVQLAKLHGCKVITTAGRDESIAFCRDVLKADVVIDYRSEDFVARVKELTSGQGVPVVFDTVGGDTFKRSIECISPLGQLVTITAGDPGAAAPSLLYKSITVHYEFMGARVAYNLQPEKQGAILTAIATLVDNGKLNVHVSKVWKFEELVEAHRAIETGRTIGKMAVVVKV
ncbi:MAG TPA: zinc-binding dehydrogenase [Steroidobacteraceae bacterium]|nr:zinc-binding dehydrogenase [Steroidobacteraceae bacterium]